MSVGDLVIPFRYWLRGQWPVWSHVSIAVCLLFISAVSFRKEPDGSLGSIQFMCDFRGDSDSLDIQRFLVVSRWDWRAADTLSGSGPLLSGSGSRWAALLCSGPVNTSLASSSAFSFPSTPLCPDIQHSITSRFRRWCSLCIRLVLAQKRSIR